MTRPRCSPGRAERCDYIISSDKIPQVFSGFKIAHISDMHSHPASGVCEIIENAVPDIIVITGDLLHDDDKPTEEIDKIIKRLAGIAPVYFISGNHDLWRQGHKEIFEKYEDMGAVYLDGKCVFLERNGETIMLCGIGDPFSKVTQIIKENNAEAFSKMEKTDGYRILLFHRANLFDDIKDLGYDLILSGHMHGGQVRLPGMGGVLAPSSSLLSGKRMLFPKYSGGVVTSEKTTMIINRGIGNTLPLPRWGNPPEVGVITLKNVL